MKNSLIVFVLFAFISALAGSSAAPPADDRMKALQKRFESRYGELQELKSAGTVGETFDGFVDFVQGKADAAAKVVEEENADRRELYKLIAEKEKTTPEVVGQRNAQRKFEKAKKGEFLKGKDGKWTQK